MFFLAGVGLAKSDDPDCTASCGENHHMESPHNGADRYITSLTVIFAGVGLDISARPIEPLGIREINAMFSKGCFPLFVVPFVWH